MYLFFSLKAVLDWYCYYNKFPQTQWFKKHEHILTVLEVRSQKSVSLTGQDVYRAGSFMRL